MRPTVVPIVVLALVAAACSRNRRPSDLGPGALTVCVQNGAEAYGNLIARVGPTRYDVMPGREVCKQVTETGPSLSLTATTIGGGAAGPLRFATTLYPTGSRCWRWRLSSAQASQSDVVPCDENG